MPDLLEAATYQPPLPISEFTEVVTYWAEAANPNAYGGMETTHHIVKETEIGAIPDAQLQQALQLQLYLNRSAGMFALPICNEQHELSHTVYIHRGRRFEAETQQVPEEGWAIDDVLPIFVEPKRRSRLFGWLGKKASIA